VFIVRLLLCFVLLTGCLTAEETLWSYPLTFESQDVRVQLLNWELTRDKKTLLLHAKLESRAPEALYFYWRDLFVLRNAAEESCAEPFDALLDRNGAGLTRTVNEFRLQRGEKARITIPLLIQEGGLPGRLELPDGRRSILIR